MHNRAKFCQQSYLKRDNLQNLLFLRDEIWEICDYFSGVWLLLQSHDPCFQHSVNFLAIPMSPPSLQHIAAVGGRTNTVEGSHAYFSHPILSRPSPTCVVPLADLHVLTVTYPILPHALSNPTPHSTPL